MLTDYRKIEHLSMVAKLGEVAFLGGNLTVSEREGGREGGREGESVEGGKEKGRERGRNGGGERGREEERV